MAVRRYGSTNLRTFGPYAWLKEPLSARALEDVRQTELIQQAWADSGEVYGYRKLTDDLRDAGETCSETV